MHYPKKATNLGSKEMKMNWKYLLYAILMTSVWACGKDEVQSDEFIIGKNIYTTEVNGDLREYYVHVPSGYDGLQSVPAVIMLHGASGRGEITYNNSGWKELGETENFITIFPTAWSYCWIKHTGVIKDTTRWNSLPGVFTFCDGEIPRDDVKFLRQMLTEINQRLMIDTKKVYMVGFSSGAQMTFRCAVEMSDVITAAVQSGGTHRYETTLKPSRKMPIVLELGNSDAAWFEPGMFPPLPLFDTLLSNYGLFQRIIDVHATTFDFEPTYELSGDETAILIATFKGIPDPDRTFKFTLIDGLDHSYPNGKNHPFYGAKHHWEWMKQYSLP